MPPIVTLTTDFGLRDPFVGVMKGVILTICPEARLVDLTHEIAPHDVLGAQLALEASAPFFPAGTVHLAVVDPGVGSARRALGVQAGTQCFVGPDNGLLSFALRAPGWTAVALTEEAYRLMPVSRTFHGRDVFAPAAAHLARGTSLDRLGPAVLDPARLEIPTARLEGSALVGEVIAEDRFGNLITSLTAEGLAGLAGSGTVEIEVGAWRIGPLRSSYAEGEPGMPAPIVGSRGRLEVFVREGSALEVLQARRGTPVRAKAS
ncbi:MAG: SAM-dependent chlorinase/fluorinase [Candidatus Rokubacteria bacterium]|nr:SAM-dependent chlorinase/fluorinase [Candidatus Rokubacteria bacterium]